MKITKIIFISLFLILVFTGLTFAKSNINFDIPSVTLGITLTKTINSIDDITNYSPISIFDMKVMALQEAKTYPWAKGMKIAGVLMTVGSILSWTSGMALMIAGTIGLNPTLIVTSYALMIVGGVILVPGIVLWVIGGIFNKKHKKALESTGNDSNNVEFNIREDGAIGLSW